MRAALALVWHVSRLALLVIGLVIIFCSVWGVGPAAARLPWWMLLAEFAAVTVAQGIWGHFRGPK